MGVLIIKRIKAVIGTVEELSASPRSLALVRDQFETNYFGAVNIIKAVLPTMRNQMIGHIIVLTGISRRFPIEYSVFNN